MLCCQRTFALRAPTAFSARIESIRAENAVTVNNKDGVNVFLRDRRLRPDGSFIRTQSAIRAVGKPSAQHRNPATTGGRDLYRSVQRHAVCFPPRRPR
jgi:hypothetical protein